MTRFIAAALFLLLSLNTSAENISAQFKKLYGDKTPISKKALNKLKKTRIIFIPGILAETFQEDPRSILNLSLITKEYFGTQVSHLQDTYGLDVVRLKTSSKDIATTRSNIQAAINRAKRDHKKVFFVAHSLGGLALTEVLLEQQEIKIVQGVVYLQTPFWGSPVANVYDKNTYYIKKLLRPLLPFFNTSEEIISYLKVNNRAVYMDRNFEKIKELGENINILSIVSIANNSFTLFEPAVNIMEFGCLSAFRGHCLTNTIYYGKKDFSDGMVPINSGIFPNADHVILNSVDHGETVVSLGPYNINRKKLIETTIQLIIK